MEERQSRNSQFVTVPGLMVLFVLAVTANYFHAWLICAFLFLFFLLCLSSYVWSRGVCRRVSVELTAEREACHAGEGGELTLKVRNRSFFPLVWLDIIIPTGPRPLIRQRGREDFSWFKVLEGMKKVTGLRERFVWMLWQQEITWQEEYEAVKRGSVEIRGLSLQAGDGIGLSAREEWYPLPVPVRLLIYPKRLAVDVSPFLRLTQDAEARSQGQTEDITILKSSRPYQTGDAMKKINWRLLASSGQMITNIYETVFPGCAAFVLDLESFRRVVVRENSTGADFEELYLRSGSMERMLSVIASCMRELWARRLQTALLIPAYGKQEAVFCVPREGHDTLAEGLEALAMLHYRAERTSFPYEDFWQMAHRLGQIYLCSRTGGKNSLMGIAENLGRGRVTILALEKTTDGPGEYDCLYGDRLGVLWMGEKEEQYEQVSPFYQDI